MKKWLTFLCIWIFGICNLVACNKALPLVEYPLDMQAVETIAKEWGEYIIEEDSALREEQTVYNLYDQESKELVCAINSGTLDGERVLSVAFVPSAFDNAILEDEYEETLAFITKLYGGFKSTSQVYDEFKKDYIAGNIEKQVQETPVYRTEPQLEESIIWESDVRGTTCRIILEQYDSIEEKCLIHVVYTSNWETFFSNH